MDVTLKTKLRMALVQDTELEEVVDEVLKSGDVQALDAFLQSYMQDRSAIKCSQQFITKLDKLVSGSLDEKDFKSARLGFAVIYKCGKNLELSSGQGLPGIIAKGLPKKMVQWFEKCRQFWIQCGPRWNEALFNLSEDFFDALMVVHDSYEEGACKITELFMYPVGHLAVNPRIYILIQKEAISKLNLMLDKSPMALKKMKILTSQEASDIMVKLAGKILEGGDFDFQMALMESLCRMATFNQRKELADRWFSVEHVASAFVKIRDSDFETDCRKFLNLVNRLQGDRRRVYSYPCLEAYLDKYELLMPPDEKLEEFWIDFNLGSHSISFYFSSADGEAQWETMCVPKNEVKSYTITEEGKRYILQLNLSELVVVGAVEGSRLTIHFSSSLDILHAARSVYGCSKNTVVPDIQVSLGEKEKNTAHRLLPAPSTSVQMVTPAKMKISESSIVLSNNTGGSMKGAMSFSALQSTTGKGKSSQKSSCDRIGELNQGELRTTAKTCNHGTVVGGSMEQSDISQQSMASKQARKKRVTEHKKSIPNAKAVAMVLAGTEEEQSLDPTCVPETQPTSGRNTDSSWSKLSISEILVMSTQKIKSIPTSEPCFSLSQQLEGQSSKKRSSDPVQGPVNKMQHHGDTVQRLRQLIITPNPKPSHQDSMEPKREMPDIRADSKGRSSADRLAAKEKQAETNSLKKKSKGQFPQNVIKATAKAPTATAMKGSIPLSIRTEAKSKAKKHAELTGNMVKLISSHYESTSKDTAATAPESRNSPFVRRPIFNMSWLSIINGNATGAGSLIKSNSKTATSSTKNKNDIFTFNPVSPLSTGEKDKTSKISAMSSSGIYDSSALLSTNKKGQPVAKEKRHVKKHLFSDTNTDDAMTEVSWLRESSRKPKPKVAKYSRQVPIKPKGRSTHASYESSDLTLSSEKPVEVNIRPDKNKHVGKKRVVQPKKMEKTAAAPKRPHAASRRPQRAAASHSKSYKELDSDDSQSEAPSSVFKSSSSNYVENVDLTQEAFQRTKRKTATKNPNNSYTKPKNYNHSSHSKVASEQPPSSKQQRPEPLVPETSKFRKRNISPAQEQMDAFTESLAACRTSPFPSTPLIEDEKMRSAERSKSTGSPFLTPFGSPLPFSPTRSCQDTPSPILLLPKPCSRISSKGNIKPLHFSKAEKKHKSQFFQSDPTLPSLTPVGQIPAGPNVAEISPIHQHQTSPPPSLLPALPLLTSTLTELSKPSVSSSPQSPFPEDNHGSHFGSKQVCSVSQVSLSLSSTQSSVRISRCTDSSTAAFAIKTENSPSSNKGYRKLAQIHMSGPGRKRSISSSSKEDKKEHIKKSKWRGECSPRMKPRKLFKSFTEVSAEHEISQVMSSSHMVASCYWEDEDGHEDMDEDLELQKVDVTPSHLLQKFSSELKEKFEKRHKMTEIYSKQFWKTIQHHASSLNVQVASHRTQWHEQLQEVLLEEINKLEQNDTVLQSIEQDMAFYWKKQSVAFWSYKEQENKRNVTLKKALQSNACHSLEYEEQLFTSQMCLIRKDLKSVQDRHLCQMQKEEIQSVKRSLHALFFP